MSHSVQCPKCGGGLKTQQIDYRIAAYCDRCGQLPYRDGLPEIGRGYFPHGREVSERARRKAREAAQ